MESEDIINSRYEQTIEHWLIDLNARLSDRRDVYTTTKYKEIISDTRKSLLLKTRYFKQQ